MSNTLKGSIYGDQSAKGALAAAQSASGSLNAKQRIGGNAVPRGKDGVSPVVSVEEIDGGHRITIKDIYGTKTIDVMDGKDGYTPIKGIDYFDGEAGYSPIRGTDYWTDADKASIVTDVINALPTWEGGSY